MSIIFETVTIKNFLSVGAVTQSLDLNNSSLTLILGENVDSGGVISRNGAGKTVLIHAVSYALFGYPINDIKKDNLINHTNGKNMVVTLNFSVDGVKYRIIRGRKPSILKFFVNDTDVSDKNDAQGDSRETQSVIESIINMTWDMFTHIAGLNTYSTPFLEMKSNDQRAIMEQLLGITVLSEKAEIVRNLIRESREEIQLEEFKIKAIEEANKQIIEQIDSLKKRQKLWNKKHVEDVEKLAAQYAQLSELDIDTELSNHRSLAIYNEKHRALHALKNERTRIESEISRESKLSTKLKKELVSLKEHKCHTCGQDFHDEKHNEVVSDKERQLEASTALLASYHESLGSMIMEDIGHPPNVFYSTESEAVEHRSKLESLAARIESKIGDTDPYHEGIIDMESKALRVIDYDIINVLSKKMEHQKFLLDLLTNKDSFIRKRIMDQNLNYLNSRLTFYLEKTGLPHQVVFKNDLSVEISELGRDMDYGNLSRGESNRVIMSLSFAFRDVWESMYRPINMLFIDELIDNGLDSIGMENTLGILKGMVRDRKKSIWLVSHRDELVGRVDNVLKAVKESGFSSYESNVV